MHLQSQAIRLYNYTKIQGPRFERNYIIARDKKRDENLVMVRHFKHSQKTHLHTIMKVYNTHD